MRIIGKLFNWPRLLCCFCHLGQCISWTPAQNFKSFWTVYAKLPCCSSLFCLPFGCRSKQHNHCNIQLKSESITGQLQNWSSWQNFWAVLGQLFLCIKNKSVYEYYSWALFMRTVYLWRTGFRLKTQEVKKNTLSLDKTKCANLFRKFSFSKLYLKQK